PDPRHCQRRLVRSDLPGIRTLHQLQRSADNLGRYRGRLELRHHEPVTASYNPPHQKTPRPTNEPLEIDLVFNVIACGTCEFFWPDDPSKQPYGPYPSFDMSLDPPPP